MARDYLKYTGWSQRRARFLLKRNEKKTEATGQEPGPEVNGTYMTPWTAAQFYHKEHVKSLTDLEVQACRLTGNNIDACIAIYEQLSSRAFSKLDVAVDHADYETLLKGTQVVFSSDSITKPQMGDSIAAKVGGDHQSNFLLKAFPNAKGFLRKPLNRYKGKIRHKFEKSKHNKDP